MIWKIAQKEFMETRRDGRFLMAAVLVFGLLAAAFFLGWQNYAKTSEERSLAREISRRQWLEQGAKNPHSAAHHSIFAFKPIAPLALADTGVNPFAGVAVWLEAHKQNESVYSAARDSTAAARRGNFYDDD